jgi:hypothetical protein
MFKQSSTLEYRLEQEAVNLRKQAEGMPEGIRRDELLRKAGQIDVAQVNKSLSFARPARSDIAARRPCYAPY